MVPTKYFDAKSKGYTVRAKRARLPAALQTLQVRWLGLIWMRCSLLIACAACMVLAALLRQHVAVCIVPCPGHATCAHGC